MDLKDLFKGINQSLNKGSETADDYDPEAPASQVSPEENTYSIQNAYSLPLEPLEEVAASTSSTSSSSFGNLLNKNNYASEPLIIDVGPVIPTKDQDFFAPPSSMKDIGLSPISIQDLLLKCLFYQSNSTGKELANRVRLPLHSIVDPMLMKLAEEKFVEVTGSSGLGGHNKIYRLTSGGYNRAEDVLKVSNYVGPAPVSLNDYTEAVMRYGKLEFSEEALKAAYKDIVMDEKSFEQIGPALMSGKSMFLYGPAGTGKTSVAERITRCYNDTIKVPYAVSVQGIPMRFFDYFLHQPIEQVTAGSLPPINQTQDARWIEIKRPCIIVGPEFTIASADLQYDPSGPSYQFPSTIKANGGVFVVDDFGRQKENPETLLNRWIIPLDKQKDILNLKSGQQIGIPFKVFTIFSTNLDPKQLVDDAFLRRLAYKIKINYPSLETYCQIFANESDKADIEWSDDLLDYFIQTHYLKANRPMRACDPKDVLARVSDVCKFKRQRKPYQLSKELIDKACHSYFVTG
jgi:DNA-binding PadR family transcriptional regulator